MRTPLALAAGLSAGAVLAALVQGCGDCTHSVYDLEPGTYRLDVASSSSSSSDDASYRLLYTSDPPEVVETFTRNGTEYRIEYAASAPTR